MRYVPRELEEYVMRAARSFPAVVLTGPRRASKTWLLPYLLPKALVNRGRRLEIYFCSCLSRRGKELGWSGANQIESGTTR
jgi:predicted AAA+ superfamily ATPase